MQPGVVYELAIRSIKSVDSSLRLAMAKIRAIMKKYTNVMQRISVTHVCCHGYIDKIRMVIEF